MVSLSAPVRVLAFMADEVYRFRGAGEVEAICRGVPVFGSET